MIDGQDKCVMKIKIYIKGKDPEVFFFKPLQGRVKEVVHCLTTPFQWWNIQYKDRKQPEKIQKVSLTDKLLISLVPAVILSAYTCMYYAVLMKSIKD